MHMVQQLCCLMGAAVQAAKMLHYLGDHILMLTSMNLRDYLRLKVEIQGTSGEGSKAVKSFRLVSASFCQHKRRCTTDVTVDAMHELNRS